MSYAEIDPVIHAWVKKHSFKQFFTKQVDREIRCVYLSEKTECFQIWIDEPENGIVKLGAVDVETTNDEEFSKNWSVPVIQLEAALEAAVSTVRLWLRRSDR